MKTENQYLMRELNSLWEEWNFGSPIKVDEKFEEIVGNKAEEIQGKQ